MGRSKLLIFSVFLVLQLSIFTLTRANDDVKNSEDDKSQEEIEQQVPKEYFVDIKNTIKKYKDADINSPISREQHAEFEKLLQDISLYSPNTQGSEIFHKGLYNYKDILAILLANANAEEKPKIQTVITCFDKLLEEVINESATKDNEADKNRLENL